MEMREAEVRHRLQPLAGCGAVLLAVVLSTVGQSDKWPTSAGGEAGAALRARGWPGSDPVAAGGRWPNQPRIGCCWRTPTLHPGHRLAGPATVAANGSLEPTHLDGDQRRHQS